jgi:hypothetical protein
VAVVEDGRNIEALDMRDAQPFRILAAGKLERSPPPEPKGSEGKYHTREKTCLLEHQLIVDHNQ